MTVCGKASCDHSDYCDCWPEEIEVPAPKSPRADLLDEAKHLITGDRNCTYGPPTADFARASGILNAMGYRALDGRNLLPHDIAILVMAVKLSRLTWRYDHRDGWVDIAGYAGCGYECSLEEEEPKG